MEDSAEFFTFVIGAIIGAVVGGMLVASCVVSPMKANYGKQYCASKCGKDNYEVTYVADRKPNPFGCICYLPVNDGEKVEDALKRQMETK